MNTLKVKKVRPDARVPERASNFAVGFDVFASRVLDKHTKEVVGELPITIESGGSALIGIGVQFAVPWPWQCEVRPRSGLASKYDIELSNSPGTIDPDFRGEAGILLRNRGKNLFVVEKDMRVAQLIFSETKIPFLEESEELPPTIRGAGGFGSTGLFKIKEGTEAYLQQIRENDRFFMEIAVAASKKSNCVRGCKRNLYGEFSRDEHGLLIGQTRRFGCVIVKNNNVVSMGYNAQYDGSPFCSEVGCLREEEKIPSGTRIERCRAVHAEWWAIANLAKSGVGMSTIGATIYLTAEPCEICAKLIAQLGIETMVMLEGAYPQNGTKILKYAGIGIRYVKL